MIHGTSIIILIIRWLRNIKDWCISRQLWWGHRIPAYKVFEDGKDTDKWCVGVDEEDAKKDAIERLHFDGSKITLKQV